MANPPGQPPNKTAEEIEALKAQVAALTARVYQLERKSGYAPEAPQHAIPPTQLQSPARPPAGTMLQPAQIVSRPSPLPPPPMPPSRQQLPQLQPSLRSGSTKEDVDLEKKIGQYWLNRIGIVAMLIGVSYFLKYAFENNWIGPGGRIVIGLLAGIGLVLWSEQFRARGYAAFSYSLKAVGIGTLYLSLWGAFQVYHLIPSAAAFVAMAVVKPWRRLLWGSFAGTLILYLGWYGEYYSQDQRAVTVLFAALFAALFAIISLATRYEASTRFPGPSITLTLLPLFNAAMFFLALYAMYERETATLTWFALTLAAVYLGIGGAFKKRFPAQDTKFINSLHVAIAIAFLTIAIPLKLDAQWITIGWLVESAALLWISVRTETDFLRYLAVAALTLGIIRLLFYDQFHTEKLLFNARFATYAVAIAVLGGIAIFGERHASEQEMVFIRVAVVGVNLLALIALTWEASDYYFRRQLASSVRVVADYRQLSLARDFSYSAIWLIYGAALMTIGFRQRSAFARWQSLLLIAFTIGKVFFYDVSQLGGSYRILSFIGLGAVLLGISFIYQRDWLKLSSRSSDKSAQGT